MKRQSKKEQIRRVIREEVRSIVLNEDSRGRLDESFGGIAYPQTVGSYGFASQREENFSFNGLQSLMSENDQVEDLVHSLDEFLAETRKLNEGDRITDSVFDEIREDISNARKKLRDAFVQDEE